jgi:hypothetical protein
MFLPFRLLALAEFDCNLKIGKMNSTLLQSTKANLLCTTHLRCRKSQTDLRPSSDYIARELDGEQGEARKINAIAR